MGLSRNEPARSANGRRIVAALTAARQTARDEAAITLAEAGFIRRGEDEWEGELHLQGPRLTIPARVRLPKNFPDALPEVFVDEADIGQRIAHVESTGKVCIVPISGVLLDADKPRKLVEEALVRAAREVTRGLLGESEADLQLEFQAYWQEAGDARIYSLCNPEGPARAVSMLRLRGMEGIDDGEMLLADTEEAGTQWASNLGTTSTPSGVAFFVPLRTSFLPPEFGKSISLDSIRAVINQHGAVEDASNLRTWLRATILPATILLSLPEAASGTGRTLIALRINQLDGETGKRAQAGFRPGRVPSVRVLAMSGALPVNRLNLVRVDRNFVGPRGGAALALATQTVVLIGAGAVGSEIATQLAALGVGQLRVIDPEELGPENVHRHALGMRYVWQSKAITMCKELSSRFPHSIFESRNGKIEDVLCDEPAFVAEADLIIIALGDETLERRLNKLLHGGAPRVHAWVEPLGIAGHVLACGVHGAGAGCYECLFMTDPELGLVNRAALTAPGQEVRRSLAGCAGTFSPFSTLDARRTAIEATELIGRVLERLEKRNTLFTWRGDVTLFEQEGLQLSRRATVVPQGARVFVHSFVDNECEVCSGASVVDVEHGANEESP